MFYKPLGLSTNLSEENGGTADTKRALLFLVTVIVLAMALIAVFDTLTSNSNSVDLTKEIPFKCSAPECGQVVYYTLGELKEMQKDNKDMWPIFGPSTQPVDGGDAEGMDAFLGEPKLDKDGQPILDNRMIGPMMGPLVLDCPVCKKHTLTQAVKCPKCDAVFIMEVNPMDGIFDDKCPKCGVSYSKAWQEEYKKKHGK